MPVNDENVFNSYLLRAVDEINQKWALRGYDSAAYTHNISMGHLTFKATKAPYTMCVAAQMEIIVTALNIYLEDGGDSQFLKFLPDKQWLTLASGTFKDLVWVNSGSLGTASALMKFGMGEEVPFSELKPGCFINLNRVTGSGHAVLFLNYLDASGNELPTYSDAVVGFKYYSSQGKKIGGGFDYRYAFFDGVSPVLGEGRKRDLGVMRSAKQKYLNCGFMYMPGQWDSARRDQALNAPLDKSFLENDVNPNYLIQDTVDD